MGGRRVVLFPWPLFPLLRMRPEHGPVCSAAREVTQEKASGPSTGHEGENGYHSRVQVWFHCVQELRLHV